MIKLNIVVTVEKVEGSFFLLNMIGGRLIYCGGLLINLFLVN